MKPCPGVQWELPFKSTFNKHVSGTMESGTRHRAILFTHYKQLEEK